MPANKKQHYVPKLLMRNFASPDNKKLITVANLKSKSVYADVPITNQLQEAYLYGKGREDGQDSVENLLQHLESAVARTIRNAIDNSIFPAPHTEEFLEFLGFLALQRGRTPTAGREWEAQMTAILRTFLRRKGHSAEQVDELAVRSKLPELMMMGIDGNMAYALHDLEDLLVVSRTGLEFVLPDTGILFHNEWGRRSAGIGNTGVTGYSCHGLQVLLPISSRCIWVKYDSLVYAAPGRVVELLDTGEVAALNKVIISHAEECVYFSGHASTRSFVEDFDSHVNVPTAERRRACTIHEIGGTGAAVYTYIDLPPVHLDPPWLRVKPLPAFVPVECRGTMYRSRSLQLGTVDGGPFDGPHQGHIPKWIRAGRYSLHRRDSIAEELESDVLPPWAKGTR